MMLVANTAASLELYKSDRNRRIEKIHATEAIFDNARYYDDGYSKSGIYPAQHDLVIINEAVESAVAGDLTITGAAAYLVENLNFPGDSFLRSLQTEYSEAYIEPPRTSERKLFLEGALRDTDSQIREITKELSELKYFNKLNLMEAKIRLFAIKDERVAALKQTGSSSSFKRRVDLFKEKGFVDHTSMRVSTPRPASEAQISQATREAISVVDSFIDGNEAPSAHELSSICIYFKRIQAQFTNADIIGIVESCLTHISQLKSGTASQSLPASVYSSANRREALVDIKKSILAEYNQLIALNIQ